MIIAIGEKDGVKVLILGLSRGNIERLIEGRPMVLRNSTHPPIPPDLGIDIIFGETEDSLAKTFREAGAVNPEDIQDMRPGGLSE